ncbi:ABC transporter permease [Myroides sp. DF42-4-2]|uniref:ABC transporter permease n=1 Tax=unclassified Myroides TaxID=2642485 RepID=UPI0025776D81|nr:ABC transporter permease [Myroides sp. DF42-4-2]MDM1408790.1 ABC transporter permease [Myroides sp. DF42-4-2]
MLFSWFTTFRKNIQKSILFFCWTILGLAIGIACLLLSLFFLQDEWSYNKWMANVEQYYEVNVTVGEEANAIVVPAAVGPQLLQQKQVENYCYYALDYIDFYAESKFHQAVVGKILNTQTTFFDFFNFEFIYGSVDEVVLHPMHIAISEEVAQRFFPHQNPIGQTLSLAHSPYQVAGVYKLTDKATIMPDIVLMNMDWNEEVNSSLWQENGGGLLVKVKRKEDCAAIASSLVTLVENNEERVFENSEKVEQYNVYLSPLKEGRFISKQTALLEGKTKLETLYLLVGCSVLIFLLAILNYINLNQAGILSRIKEFHLRAMLGSSSIQLMLQIGFETLLNVLMAMGIALMLVEFSMPIYNLFLHKTIGIKHQVLWSGIVLVICFVVFLAGGILSLYARRLVHQLHHVKTGPKKSKSLRLREVSLFIQIAIAFFFVVGGWIISRQVHFMEEKHRGFEGDQVVQVKLFTQQIRRKFYRNDKLTQEIQKIKGVKSVALSTIAYEDKSIKTKYTAYYGMRKIPDFVMEGIDNAYIDMVGFKKIAYQPIEVDSLPKVWINEKFAEKMGVTPEEALGNAISYDRSTYLIEGVVNNFFSTGFEEAVQPIVLFQWKDIEFLPYGINYLSIELDQAVNRAETLERLQSFWIVNVDYEYPFQQQTLSKQFESNYQHIKSQKRMFLIWNVAVVFMALFGLYASLSLYLEQKQKEIIIRKIVGASPRELFFLLGKPFFITVVLACITAVYPVYWIMNAWLNKFKYQQEIEAYPFVFSFLLVVGLVFFIIRTKVRIATKGDFIKCIKYE